MDGRIAEKKKNEPEELKNWQYNMVLGLILICSVEINAMVFVACGTLAEVFGNRIANWVVYAALAFIGLTINKITDNSYIKFMGFNIFIIPFGVILNMDIPIFSSSVMNLVIVINVMVITLAIISTFIDGILDNLAGTIGISVGYSFIVQIILWTIEISEPAWYNLAVAVLFSIYISYKWSEAQKIEKTMKNAVDSALSIFTDRI